MKRLVRVVGESMAPTYRSSDLLLTRPVGRAGARLQRGDVVVFRHGELRMIKRVVGLPGDLVELEAGRLFVNGEPVDGRPGCRAPTPRPGGCPGRATSWPVTTRPSRTTPGSGTSPSSRSRVSKRWSRDGWWGLAAPGDSSLVDELLQPVGLRDRNRPSRADHDQTLPGEALQSSAEALGGGVQQGGHVLLGQRQGHRGNAAPPGAGQTEQVVGQAALDVARGQ